MSTTQNGIVCAWGTVVSEGACGGYGQLLSTDCRTFTVRGRDAECPCQRCYWKNSGSGPSNGVALVRFIDMST